MTTCLNTDCPPLGGGENAFASLGDLDRIGDAFCQTAVQPADAVQRYRHFRMRCLATTLWIIDVCDVPTRAAVSVRLKRLDSIRRKINRVGTRFTLGRLDDVVGVRVVCQDLRTVRELSVRLRSSSTCYRVKDYVGDPAITGYRGIHHIMRFRQPVTATNYISVRFEIQVRTYLQHRWAVWSESHGEAVKLGTGSDEEEHRTLRALSENIARWENDNPGEIQAELPPYSDHRSIAVCWKTPNGRAVPYFFQDDLNGAVEWLNYLEMTYHRHRSNALLLVGVTELDETVRWLRLTHPLFTGSRVVDPAFYLDALRNRTSLSQG